MGIVFFSKKQKLQNDHIQRRDVFRIRVTQVCSLAMCCRAASIPEAQDLSRSSSNASSFASVVEEHEAEEDSDTGLVGTGRPGMLRVHILRHFPKPQAASASLSRGHMCQGY